MKNFVLEGPGGIPAMKQSPSVTTSKPFTFNSIVALGAGSTVGGVPIGTGGGSGPAFTTDVSISEASATAFQVGLTLANPAFNIDTSTASSVTGLNIRSAASGGGVTLSVSSSSANEALNVSTRGTGALNLNPTGTGNLAIGNNTGGNIFISAANASTIRIGSQITTQTAGGARVFSLGNNLMEIDMGSGAPTTTAPIGSLYMRSDGSSVSTRLYVSAGSGTWIAVTTVS